MSPTPTIAQHSNLQLFFRDVLQEAASKLDIGLTETSEYYLVNLLADASKPEVLFNRQGNHLEDPPLAHRLAWAMHADNTADSIRYLKQMGDCALVFPERASRKMVNREYFIGMGSGAYHSLASMLGDEDTFADIFTELGDQFEHCVDLFAAIKLMASGQTDLDLLDCYERWLKNGNKQLESILRKAGIPTTDRFGTA